MDADQTGLSRMRAHAAENLESSSQALILVPLVTSIVFGMLTSTLLIMLVLPSVYAILEDVGFVKLSQNIEKNSINV